MPLEQLKVVLNKLLQNYEKMKRRNQELEKRILLYREREKMLERKVGEIEKKLREIMERFSVIER